MPTPFPAPDWPEAPAAQHPLYTADTAPLPAPAVTEIDPVANGATLIAATAAQTAAPIVDTEAGKTGVVSGVATATLNDSVSLAQLGNLQLRVARTAVTTSAVTVHAEVLPTTAAALSPLGMAFKLAVTSTAAVNASSTNQPLQLTLDYSQIPIRYGGSFTDRLTLYHVTSCAQEITTLANGETAPAEPCRIWEPLSGDNDRIHQQLTVVVTPTLTSTTAPQPDSAVTTKLYLPLISQAISPATELVEVVPVETDDLYVLAAAASSQQGNYAATPLANLGDYQVNLSSGSAQTSYPVPLPPAAAGLAPAVALTYDSGSVDGMTSNKNNQPGWTGIGWNLESGYIMRHLQPCNVPAGHGNLCLVGGPNANGILNPSTDAYSIVLNGVASRLIHIPNTNNSYRLQNDPSWKVQRTASGNANHPDEVRTYWKVTTPDGTVYQFGGEFTPTQEGSADLNSVFYVPIYNTNGGVCGLYAIDLCDVAWRWNLDRVEDTNSNVITYFYEQETNYYQAIDFNGVGHRRQYVRAGNVSRIEYGRRWHNSTTIPTRVNFVTEERCEGACAWPANYPDTPGDLECDSSSACDENAPTFWSKKRLNTIEPQVYDQTTSAWVSVARYDLDYTFPTPPNDAEGDTSEKKLWLNTITQKLGDGTGGLPAITYGNVMLANRWDHGVAGVSPLSMPRISQITTQLGGVVNFTYGQPYGCQVTSTDYIRYPYDCAPAWYVNGGDQGWGLFNKWKVTQQSASDSFAGNDPQTLTYSYSTPTWHYSDDPTLPDLNSCALCPARHWNDYRGSEIVTVTASSGVKTEYHFYRGMNDDRKDVAGTITPTYTLNIALSDGSLRLDENWLRGQIAEERQLTDGNSIRRRTVNWFTWKLNAGSGINGAYFVGLQSHENTLYGTVSKTTRTDYTYDSYGNVTREIDYGDTAITTDDRNVERSYLYNIDFWVVNKAQWEKLWSGTGSGSTNQELAYTQYAYDNYAYGIAPSDGDLTKVKQYAQRTPTEISAETKTTYDSFGRPTVVTDARGNRTITAYHPFYGYVSSVTNDRPPVNIMNNLDHVTSFVNDPRWGVQTQITDPNGKVTDLQYDAYGRLQKVWLPTENKATDPASLEFVYDAAARPANVKSRQLREKSSSAYLDSWAYVDGFGRNLQTQTPLADGSRAVVAKQYNNLGQLMLVSAPFQYSGAAGSTFVSISDWETVANYHFLRYDALGNLWVDATRSASSELWSTTTIHDAWRTRTYDPRGNRTDYEENAFGQLVKVTEYNVYGIYNTAYGYDLQGNLTSVTDAANNVTTITYDLLGRKKTMTDPDMGSWYYGYDAVGNLIGQSDGRLNVLHLEYDDLNRLIRKRRDTAGTGSKVAEYFYDASGQKGLLDKSLAYDNAGGSVLVEVDAVTYDNRNRLTQQRWVVGGSGTFRMDYAYNEADQRTSLTYPADNVGAQGETVSYSYNSVGQLTGASGSGVAYISAATYNAQGQLTQMVNDTSSNGLTRQWSYETNTLRLNTLQAGKNAAVDDRQKLTYSYDNNGNVTSLIDTINAGQKQCFQYDYLNRLTLAFTGSSDCTYQSATGTGAYSLNYDYDAIGNMTTKDGMAMTYGDAAHKHAVTAAFGNTYSYDGNGNQTGRVISGVSSTFTYDYENRLTAISGGATANFVYDADGNRVKSTVGGVTTVYIAGVFEFIENGTTDKITKYYEGNAMRRSGYGVDDGLFYLLQDHLKSSSAIVNQAGSTVATNDYYPYGGNRGGTAFSGLSTKRFTGQYHESSLPGGEGLSYYNARWYDAQLGRFLNADTLVPQPSDPQLLNRYSYVRNNPLVFTDSSGHCIDGVSTAVCLAAGGALAGGVVGGTWWAINEAWYGEVDLSLDLVWTEESWIPGVTIGEDWDELGASTFNGMVAGGLLPLGGVASAIGIGVGANSVGDHVLYSLTGQGTSSLEHLAHGAAGGYAATYGYTLGPVFDSVFSSTAARVATKVAINGFNAGITDTLVDVAINGEPDRLTGYQNLLSNISWNMAGETYGLLSTVPKFPSPNQADYWSFFISTSWKIKETTTRAGIEVYQSHMNNLQHSSPR